MTRDHRRLAAIVSADVVGYSLLMGRDDSATLAGLKAHRRELIDPKIAEYALGNSKRWRALLRRDAACPQFVKNVSSRDATYASASI